MTKQELDRWSSVLATAQNGLNKFRASNKRVELALRRMVKALRAVGGSEPLTDSEQQKVRVIIDEIHQHKTRALFDAIVGNRLTPKRTL